MANKIVSMSGEIAKRNTDMSMTEKGLATIILRRLVSTLFHTEH
jgi:hypothetical protein